MASIHRLLRLGLAIMVALVAVGGAHAHFNVTATPRIIHVEHTDAGLTVYLRLPMALAVAGAGDGAAPAPYTVTLPEGDGEAPFLDAAALAADPMGLAALVASRHLLEIDGAVVMPDIGAIHVTTVTAATAFSTLAEAQAAFDQPPFEAGDTPPLVGDTVLDVRLFYPESSDVYRFGDAGDPGLADQDSLPNLLIDHHDGEARIYQATGLLAEPIAVDRSALTAALTFVHEGIVHILEGIDHVLFVLCLTIGALSFGNLMWRITGFTVGHTITLIGGFLGVVPSGAWFVPAVETAIAVSIIYAGIIALLRKPAAATFFIAAAIGLLHGFGFSFVLHDLLSENASNLLVSLLSFNVGVEIGQLTIVVLVWPLLLLAGRYSATGARYGRIAVVVPCIAVAALWTGERLTQLVQQTVS